MKNRKAAIIIGVVLIVAVVLGGIYFVESGKTQPDNTLVTITHREATLGSLLTSKLTDEGKVKYPMAIDYSIYSLDNKELSLNKVKLEEETTVFPEVKPGESVRVYLYDKDGKVVEKLESKVIK